MQHLSEHTPANGLIAVLLESENIAIGLILVVAAMVAVIVFLF